MKPKTKISAIVLAAGQGKRMNSAVAKQYMELCGKPLIYYSLKAFEESMIDEIVLVVGKNEVSLCKRDIVEYYGFQKVKYIVEGGLERYHSVYNGLQVLNDTEYVLIHDGARPLLTNEIIQNTINEVITKKACVVSMPVKDTVKIATADKIVESTPDRNFVYIIQTPQAFSYPLIKEAYDKIMKYNTCNITDDAMVIETMTDYKVHLICGSYENIKVTTPDDVMVAKAYLEKTKITNKSDEKS